MYDLIATTHSTHRSNHSAMGGTFPLFPHVSSPSLSTRPFSSYLPISLPTSHSSLLSPGSSSKPRYPCNTKATAAPDRCPSTPHAVTAFSRPRTSEVGCLPTVSSPLAPTRHRPPPPSGRCGSPGPLLVDPRQRRGKG